MYIQVRPNHITRLIQPCSDHHCALVPSLTTYFNITEWIVSSYPAAFQRSSEPKVVYLLCDALCNYEIGGDRASQTSVLRYLEHGARAALGHDPTFVSDPTAERLRIPDASHLT